jgi:hypothetical protein
MTADWRNRSGKVQEFKPLPPMDLNKVHTFALSAVEIKENVTTKFGVKTRVQTTWLEQGVTPKEDAHRVWVTMNESYTEKSTLIKFLAQVTKKKIIGAVEDLRLGDYLELGLEIKAMVKPRIGQDGKPSGYYDFVMESVTPTRQATLPEAEGTTEMSIDSIKLLIKGAPEKDEAMLILLNAKQPNNVIQKFLLAVRNGKITFPVT